MPKTWKNEEERKQQQNAKQREWRLKNPEKVRAANERYKEKHMKTRGTPPNYYMRKAMRKYGITREWYEQKMVEQNARCAICGEPEGAYQNGKLRRLCIDHCHASGLVRDLLCVRCNHGLGSFQDDPDLIEKAAKYLLRHAARLRTEQAA